MRRNCIKLIYSIVFLFLGTFLFAEIPDWEDDPSAYQFTATISGGIVLNNGEQMGNENDGDIFAAFDGDGNVRGIAVALYPTFGPYSGTCVYEMQMRSNAANDILIFKYYDTSKDRVLIFLKNIHLTLTILLVM